jgi:CubicO group peptidase (beta-lactamase class C family)
VACLSIGQVYVLIRQAGSRIRQAALYRPLHGLLPLIHQPGSNERTTPVLITSKQQKLMKTSFQFLTGAFLTTSLLVATTACDQLKEPVSPNPEGSARAGDFVAKGFDVKLFADKIEARLNGQVPGYGYRIWVNGVPYTERSGGGGKSRHAVDAPQRNYTASIRQDIGSCSKYMTALLVMKVLERNGKTYNEKVWPYLPGYFNPSNDFKGVTFRDLMAHTSGIVNYSNAGTQNGELNDVQDSVEDGIQDWELGKDQTPDYQNMNYALMRVALPYLAAKLENPAALQVLQNSEGNYNDLNFYVASIFRQYLRYEIFKPAGLVAWNLVDFKAWGAAASDLTKYYTSANPVAPGTNNGDYFLGSGSGGLYLSAAETAQVVAAARAGKIVKLSILNQMKTGDGNFHQLGFDERIAGAHGLYYHKNGAGSGGNAVLFDFDGPTTNVQLAITTNMGGTEVTNTGIWANLFDQSWR